MFVQLWTATRGPLPALDRPPRTATVILSADDGEGCTLLLQYEGSPFLREDGKWRFAS